MLDYATLSIKRMSELVRNGLKQLDEFPIGLRGQIEKQLHMSKPKTIEPELPKPKPTPLPEIEQVRSMRTKKQVEQFVREKFNIDLDRRKSLTVLKKEAIKLLEAQNGGSE
jgi:hypothetical protein